MILMYHRGFGMSHEYAASHAQCVAGPIVLQAVVHYISMDSRDVNH